MMVKQVLQLLLEQAPYLRGNWCGGPCARRTTAKSGIATHYCSFGMVVHVQNKHDKLTDTAMQVFHDAKIFNFIY